ncbi:MAG: phosphoribosyl-AMP cyclohydrolase [Pseudomonadota bacterium]
MSSLKEFEKLPIGTCLKWEDVLEKLPFNSEGLLPTIAQQFDSNEVLMMAWVNKESLLETLQTKRVCYWSRSRKKLWRKGEESGQVQHLKSAFLDCDGDTLLLKVDQAGPACHTGRRSCFFFEIKTDTVEIICDPLINPEQLYFSRT